MKLQTPRRHQKEGVAFFSQCLTRPGYYLRHAPTGTGKSFELRMFMYYAMARGYRFILSSVSNPVCRRFALDIYKESQGSIQVTDDISAAFRPGHVAILTHQSLWRRIETLHKSLGPAQFRKLFDKVILGMDEVHHSGLEAPRNRAAVKKFLRVVSTTATPWPDGVLDEETDLENGPYVGNQGLFTNVSRYSLADAVSDTPPTVCQWKLHPHIPLPGQTEGKTIWYYRNKDSIKSHLHLHRKAGRRIGILHSDVVNETVKARILDAFDEGKIDDLITCRMVHEGIDVPSAVSVVYGNRFRSLVFVVQAFGRTLRIFQNKVAHAYGCPETIARLELGISK